MEADAGEIDQFRLYVALILKRYAAGRYLSKNNNNILRLNTVRSSFPEALTLIPYREPEQQAYSLLKQHVRFGEMHRENLFSARYMGWLAHHEFGTDHRPFEWGLELSSGLDTRSIDYWVAQWVGVYRHLLKQIRRHEDAVFPVGYELLCTNTVPLWNSLAGTLGLADTSPPSLDLRKDDPPAVADQPLLAQAHELFDTLQTETRQRIQ